MEPSILVREAAITAGSGARVRSVRRLVPDALTVARPVFGVATVLALLAGDPSLATVCFLLGALTDAVDGLAARALGVDTPTGRSLDCRADMTFHTLVGVGLMLHAAVVEQWGVLLGMALVALAWRIGRRWTAGRLVLGKRLAASWFVAVLALLVASSPTASRPTLVTIAVIVLLPCGAYEWWVTARVRRLARAKRMT